MKMPHIVVLPQRINTIRGNVINKLWTKQFRCYVQPTTGDKFKPSSTSPRLVQIDDYVLQESVARVNISIESFSQSVNRANEYQYRLSQSVNQSISRANEYQYQVSQSVSQLVSRANEYQYRVSQSVSQSRE